MRATSILPCEFADEADVPVLVCCIVSTHNNHKSYHRNGTLIISSIGDHCWTSQRGRSGYQIVGARRYSNLCPQISVTTLVIHALKK
jgi:hypothetical protein